MCSTVHSMPVADGKHNKNIRKNSFSPWARFY